MQFLAPDVPDKVAIAQENQAITFDELTHAVLECSNQLLKLPKTIIILYAAPDIEFIIQLLACLETNRPIALFPNSISEEEKQIRLSLLGNAIMINEKGELQEIYENKTIKPHHQTALVLFTSGSTGKVKAVQLSSINIKANCHAVMKALEFKKVQDQLLFLPLSYSFGLLGQLLPGLMFGLSTRLITHFTDIKMLMEQGTIPQMWSGVPSHWVAINAIAKRYPDSAAKIKAIVSAGAPLSTALRADLKQIFPNAIIYNNYGLTEASPRVLTYSSDDPLFTENYAGYPVGDWKVKLSTENELLIRGTQIMLGYLGEKDSTKIQNGWLSTGDIAEILPNGLVAIKGRRDSLVNIGGEKVNLSEIEQKICQIDVIKEAIVIPQEDRIYGIRLVVCIEKTTLHSQISKQYLTEKIQTHLLPRKLPIQVHLMPSLPRNKHGKLDRNALVLDIDDLDEKEKNNAE
ncbi:class I adenylate-forming enzyme family protein [Legionella pneumophila]|uniref:Acyl CoA ligase n=1 Tax=Legionella pneumophila subsp. pascullei TaxID=91890 RepID=A0AAX2IX33_LEGPN|nr:class I adenylate-forming enzyme family protein [Legionella pneumophila]AMP93126.1 acyl--CoA ligase [Legionella pneumophila subsp. pascullei]AMP96092.1 acyl--CoA ligase [Legionella pneumophila subsp. pascullei]SQG91037.1 acyl CoA ligase [Legionella pneumophila subsp. pascullei]VEH07582.1 acyl CoA ligase [Legionella pneumophila subsp. pascullei]HDU8260652.1 acyl--CoA ligase [Legionella pneumophila]